MQNHCITESIKFLIQEAKGVQDVQNLVQALLELDPKLQGHSLKIQYLSNMHKLY